MEAAQFELWVRIASFVPILLCSIVGMAVTLWKWQQLRRPALPPASDLSRITEKIRLGEVREVVALVEGGRSWLSLLLWHGLGGSPRPTDTARRVALGGEQLGYELEYGLGALGLIATLGPLFGLLGTVVGITVVFERLASTAGVTTPQELAGGIGTALHTTIGGLIVGVLALVSHRYLEARVDQALAQLSRVRLELGDLLDEGAR